jgi:hypothetical protein
VRDASAHRLRTKRVAHDIYDASVRGAHKLLTFLQESGAVSKPEAGPMAEVPPEPD